MSTTRNVALALLWLPLIAATPVSTPQAPPPVPGEVAVQNAQRSDGEKRATATEQPSATQAPTVTPTAEPSKAAHPSAAVASENKQEAQPIRVAPVDVHFDSVDVKKDWADYAALFFTALLIGISAVQIYYLRGTLRETGIAANAALIAANVARDALRAEHRPRVVLTEPPHIYVRSDGWVRKQFRFAVKNFGKTPALNFRACLFYDLFTTPSLADSPDYRKFVAFDLDNAPIGTLSCYASVMATDMGTWFDRPFDLEESGKAADGQARLFAGIRIAYSDCFDPPQRYTETFLFVNAPSSLDLIPESPPNIPEE